MSSLPTRGRSQKLIDRPRGTKWVVFVDNLSRRVSRKAIWEYFKRHGEVVKVFIPAINRRPRYKDSTFAFVHFSRKEDMENAITKVHNAVIDKRVVSVAKAKFAKREVGRVRRSTMEHPRTNPIGKFTDAVLIWSYKEALVKAEDFYIELMNSANYEVFFFLILCSIIIMDMPV
ncbi:hypothetical protein HRI_003186600 [Hibiscus trionum]|uniref:RRM domain-containing protein n=1 Tax=Hibiscus trionum TaxID=183268 RepID=A0A9W7IGZ4_HIBTR|nr:hypothetical protein HRI_003186600 [Hibiscus trionum]